jgi:hypothetical protein
MVHSGQCNYLSTCRGRLSPRQASDGFLGAGIVHCALVRIASLAVQAHHFLTQVDEAHCPGQYCPFLLIYAFLHFFLPSLLL